MGPLSGVRIVEIAGIGPGPFCAMMLADHGAEVIRIERAPPSAAKRRDVLNRSRKALAVDLKQPAGVDLVRRLTRSCEGLIEGFRPGVMERLGLGPDVLIGDNPKLVYGRMTGWGQTGPNAAMAGHDIDYIALSGALDAIGRPGEAPVPPLNLVGDFGGGGMMLAFGMVSAILHARATGVGQVIDCAMTEGSAVLMAMTYSLRAGGIWSDTRGANLLDGGAHFYDTYETADGKFVAIGAIEPQFYRELLQGLGVADDDAWTAQMDARRWPDLKRRLADVIRSKTRDDWSAVFEGSDACLAPVLSMAEAPTHPHNAARGSFVAVDGIVQPAPAPRYSLTPARPPISLEAGDAVTAELLGVIDYSAEDIARLRDTGVIG